MDLQVQMERAELEYFCEKSAENKAKYDAARTAYLESQSLAEEDSVVACFPVGEACLYGLGVDRSALPLKAEPLAMSEFDVVEDENGCQWIVRKSDKAAFASQSALAWMCQISQADISNIVRRSQKSPQGLRDLDLSNMGKVNNPNSGKDIDCIPADVCADIIYYYAFEARGHEKRSNAKALCKAMLRAGATVFIAMKAGHDLAVENAELAQKIYAMEDRLTKLEQWSLQRSQLTGVRSKNEYGETEAQAYFRKRDNWSEMWRYTREFIRNVGK